MHASEWQVGDDDGASASQAWCMHAAAAYYLSINTYTYYYYSLTASPPVQEPVACRADTACPATHTADVLQGALAIGTFVDGASLQQLASGGRCEG